MFIAQLKKKKNNSENIIKFKCHAIFILDMMYDEIV